MAKRWSEAELRFLRDNAQKMSLQAIAEALSVRMDDLEKKMEKLGFNGRPETQPAAKKPQTVKELSRHTEAARKDYDRGVAALQKKYDSAHSTPLPTAKAHASGPSPTATWAITAETRSMKKPA